MTLTQFTVTKAYLSRARDTFSLCNNLSKNLFLESPWDMWRVDIGLLFKHLIALKFKVMKYNYFALMYLISHSIHETLLFVVKIVGFVELTAFLMLFHLTFGLH